MNAPVRNIPVLAAPLFDPGAGRIDLTMPEGSTVAEMVAAALPAATPADLEHARVLLVNERGSIVVPVGKWHRVRPRSGARVVIRIVPGKSILRAVLSIVVAIAAVALGQYWAVGLGFTAGTTGFAIASSVIGMGVSVLGNLLINALIPPPKPPGREDAEKVPNYQITSWRNPMKPDAPVPDVLGRHRYAAPFAAMSYTEIVGDWQYVRALFNYGYGPLALSDFKIGETSLDSYDEVDIEVREGYAADAHVTYFPQQVFEENVGAELTRPYPRNDLGETTGAAAVETPVVRYTGTDAEKCSIILAFPAGLVEINDRGGQQTITVQIRIRYRLVGAVNWIVLTTLSISAKRSEAIYRQHTWQFPARGRYEVELTRMTDEHTSSQIASRSVWAAVQTIRPEYPLNFGKPLAIVALRIKATHQINGQLDAFNATASRLCLDWDKELGRWVFRQTRNPAALYRYVLQSAANARPSPDSAIDLIQLQDWHEFCELKGLRYDRVIDGDMTLREVLTEIAGAGRAAPRHDGLKWSVVIDRPQQLVIDHVNPRNSHSFQTSRVYLDPPHGFRVPFLDATNDYQSAERIVPWPGHTGEITMTEQIEFPGKTDPDEIWKEARRRMYELIYRPDTYSVIQDGPVRVATRGDLVMASFDALDRVMVSARVIDVQGAMIALDEDVEMTAGLNYAVRFRAGLSETDSIGRSVVRTVETLPGVSNALTFSQDGGDLPEIGSMVHFGAATRDSLPLIVSGIEAGDDMASVYNLLDAAPIIDELTDAEVPPAWSGRVGAEVGASNAQPPAPRWTSIASGIDGTGVANRLVAQVAPGTGPVNTASYQIDHRISGAWTTVAVPAADGGVVINTYQSGAAVQLRARALSPAGVAGPYTNTVAVIIGGADVPVPKALDSGLITLQALLGGAKIAFKTGDDTATTAVQLYRSTASVLNVNTDAVGTPLAVAPSRSYELSDGDLTRERLVSNGDFASATGWTPGSGWSIANGIASKTAGVASVLSAALSTTSGKWYRIGFDATVSAGEVRPRLSGGSDRDGTGRTVTGSYTDRVQAVSGNNAFAFSASADFAGSIDNAVIYLETATCLTAGKHYFWLEPLNDQGVAGPLAGPFQISII